MDKDNFRRIDIKGLEDDAEVKDGVIRFPSGLSYNEAEDIKYLQGLFKDNEDSNSLYKTEVGDPKTEEIKDMLEVKNERVSSVQLLSANFMSDSFEGKEDIDLFSYYNELLIDMMAGKSFEQAAKILLANLSEDEKQDFKVYLKEGVLHDGLLGKFYLISSAFNECPNQISKYKDKLRRESQFVEKCEACEGCNYNKDNMCLVTNCDLVDEINEILFNLIFKRLPESKLLTEEELNSCKTYREKIKKALNKVNKNINIYKSSYTGLDNRSSKVVHKEEYEKLSDNEVGLKGVKKVKDKEAVYKIRKMVTSLRPLKEIKSVVADLELPEQYNKYIDKTINEYGLLGVYYIDPSLYSSCKEGAELNKGSKYQYVLKMKQCDGCNHYYKGNCSIYKVPVVDKITKELYNDESFDSFVRGYTDKDIYLDEQIEYLKQEGLSNKEVIKRIALNLLKNRVQSLQSSVGELVKDEATLPTKYEKLDNGLISKEGGNVKQAKVYLKNIKMMVASLKPLKEIKAYIKGLPNTYKKSLDKHIKKALSEYGVSGVFYVDSSLYNKCKEGAEKKRGTGYQYVIRKKACDNCTYNKKGICSLYKAPLVDKVQDKEYEDGLDSFVNHLQVKDSYVKEKVSKLQNKKAKEVIKSLVLNKVQCHKASTYKGHIGYVVPEFCPTDYQLEDSDIRIKALKMMNDGLGLKKIYYTLIRDFADNIDLIDKIINELSEVENLLGYIYIDSAFLPKDCKKFKCNSLIKPLYVLTSDDRCFDCPNYYDINDTCTVFELPVVTALEYTLDGVWSLAEEWYNLKLISDNNMKKLKEKKKSLCPKKLLQAIVATLGKEDKQEIKYNKNEIELVEDDIDDVTKPYSNFW